MENYGKHFEEKRKQEEAPKKVQVKKGINLNVRETQDPTSDVIDILTSGTTVRVLSVGDPMIKILMQNKKVGYVLSEYVEEVVNG